MFVYAVRRILLLIPTMLAVSFVVFLILQMVPGDPARAAAGADAPEEDVQLIREKYGLDQPFFIQYGRWLVRVVQGDFGESFRSRRPVMDEILARFPATIELATGAMMFALFLGVPLGIWASLRPRTFTDNVITSLSSFGISLPNFFFGLILMLVLAAKLQLLPPTGRGTWRHLILPMVTLGFPYIATYARFARSNMLDVLSEDYIRTARAKGLSYKTVIFKHALINAAIPIVTLFGVYFGHLLGGRRHHRDHLRLARSRTLHDQLDRHARHLCRAGLHSDVLDGNCRGEPDCGSAVRRHRSTDHIQMIAE